MSAFYFPPSLHKLVPMRGGMSPWTDHVPFAYDLIWALRPRMLVELGVSGGVSYFAFCQSMRDHEVDGLCYGIDHFQGESHEGKLSDEVFDEVSQFNRNFFPGFSYILKSTFENALQHFAEESIDLLHIDGFHTYESVQEDFESWYPKVRPGGIVLMHDIRARIKDFGVWKFWEDLAPQHEHFAFNHGFGLGVIRKLGGNREAEPQKQSNPLLDLMFSGDEAQQEQLRRFYVHAAHYVHLNRKHMRETGQLMVKAKPA